MITGQLSIVGSGIKFAGHMTLEAKAHIEQADYVYYSVSEPAIAQWIETLNPNAKSSDDLYQGTRPRNEIYDDIAQAVADPAIAGSRVCAVFYGHPGVFVDISQMAMKKARDKGVPVKMFPGISAEDCLIADLEIDPGKLGCAQFESSSFLLNQPRFDPRSHLILWQISVIGERQLWGQSDRDGNKYLGVLADYLMESYPADHEVIVYVAPVYPGFDPVINKVALKDLSTVELTGPETLFVPAYGEYSVSFEMRNKLDV